MSKEKKLRNVCWILFVVYLATLLWLTVLRNDFLKYPLFSHGAVNVPFSCLVKALEQHNYFYFLYLVLGNVVWFVPFGCLLPFLTGRPKKLPGMLLLSLLVSFAIEFMQYAFGTGESELDDLILNTLGAAIGFILFKLYMRFKEKRKAALPH